eukprot:6492234-Lingulodinium_polyedra.AAC.1
MAAVPQREIGVVEFPDPLHPGDTLVYCLTTGQVVHLQGAWSIEYGDDGFAYVEPVSEDMEPVWWKDLPN